MKVVPLRRAEMPAASVVALSLFLLLSATSGRGQGPVRLVERREVTGTVQSVRTGLIELRTDDGKVLPCHIQDDPEKGVALKGVVIKFPADVHVSGTLQPDWLKPGMLIEFEGQVNRAGKTSGNVEQLRVVSAVDHSLKWEPVEKSPDSNLFIQHRICAQLYGFRRGRLIIDVPPGSGLRQSRVSFVVDDTITVGLESRDYQMASSGDQVRLARLARFDTGDWVIEKLDIQLAGDRPAKMDTESKYAHFSNESKPPRELRSAHFLLHTDISDRQGKILLDKLETMLRFVSSYYGHRPDGLIECYVVEDLSRWPLDVFPAEARQKIRAGAGITISRSLGNLRKSVVYACDQHSVVQHEAVHAYCAQTFGTAGPTWYAEGMAEMGNYWKDKQRAVDISPTVITYLKNADSKSLLKIVQDDQVTGDSWQAYSWRWALCYLLANNPNYAAAFKQLGVGLMLGRPGVSFENTYGRVANQISFEYDFFIRHVDNGYRVDLCAWDWNRPFKVLSKDQRRSLKVEAARGWQATGIRLSAGESYDFVALGEWKVTPEESIGADGLSDGRGRLLGVLMSDTQLGKPFQLGERGVFIAEKSGGFYLRCQDHWNRLDDNEGKITFHLRKTLAEDE